MESYSGKGFHRAVASGRVFLWWSLNEFWRRRSADRLSAKLDQRCPKRDCCFWIFFVFRILFFCLRFTCFAPMLKRINKSNIRVQKWRSSKKPSFWFWTCGVPSKFFFRKTFGEDVPFLALASTFAFLDSSSSSLLVSCVELSSSLVLALGYRRKREDDSYGSAWRAFKKNEIPGQQICVCS